MLRDILIVDDEECLRKVLTELFKILDTNPICFRTPRLAENYLELRKTPCLGYLIDMRIPEDLDGSERLFNYIKDKNLGIDRFVFMTGHISGHDEQVIKNTKAPLYMKPFLKQELSEIIENIYLKDIRKIA